MFRRARPSMKLMPKWKKLLSELSRRAMESTLTLASPPDSAKLPTAVLINAASWLLMIKLLLRLAG